MKYIVFSFLVLVSSRPALALSSARDLVLERNERVRPVSLFLGREIRWPLMIAAKIQGSGTYVTASCTLAGLRLRFFERIPGRATSPRAHVIHFATADYPLKFSGACAAIKTAVSTPRADHVTTLHVSGESITFE